MAGELMPVQAGIGNAGMRMRQARTCCRARKPRETQQDIRHAACDTCLSEYLAHLYFAVPVVFAISASQITTLLFDTLPIVTFGHVARVPSIPHRLSSMSGFSDDPTPSVLRIDLDQATLPPLRGPPEPAPGPGGREFRPHPIRNSRDRVVA